MTLPSETRTENGRRPTTVVFADIVRSTELAADIGDERWAVLLERCRERLRRELAARGGEEMDTAGDGLFAVFSDPADAVAFACEAGEAVGPLGLRLRVGVHTGTCWVANDKCTGLDVNIGARIAAAADADEVLVSAPVQARLAADSQFAFSERGEVELKGVPGRRQLYGAQRSTHKEQEVSDDRNQGRSD